jgi:hypothetical protein
MPPCYGKPGVKERRRNWKFVPIRFAPSMHRRKALGSEHPLVATTLENYAATLRKTGHDDRAAEL